jgi:hypothetical protein
MMIAGDCEKHNNTNPVQTWDSFACQSQSTVNEGDGHSILISRSVLAIS